MPSMKRISQPHSFLSELISNSSNISKWLYKIHTFCNQDKADCTRHQGHGGRVLVLQHKRTNFNIHRIIGTQ
ncbi:unnamed protein product [Schistosoma bovis]|nr:unnamed protein product [Schistosoma bovis]